MTRLLIIGGTAALTGLLLLGAIAGMFTAGLQPAAASSPGCGAEPSTPVVHGHYTQQQIEQLWIATGGPAKEATVAGAVGMAESGGDPSIVNSIGAGGLMQIYPPEPGYLNPETNMRIALRKWKESQQARGDGWLPWETYTTGAYRRWLGKTERGVGTPTLPVPCLVDAVGGSTSDIRWNGGTWPMPLPGFPGEQCDPRIIPNLLALVQKYKLFVTDCYAPTGHAADGEHPLGLAADLVPGPGGSWDYVDRLAAWAEPVQNQPRKPFRWVGYNGDPNHGRGNHLHLSWQSSRDGPPASTVTVLEEQ